MRSITILFLLFFMGCATVEKTVEGPNGYRYTEQITAVGKGNIAEAAQSFGGELHIDQGEETIKVDVKMDSTASGKGVEADGVQMMAQFLAWMLEQTK